MAVLKSAIWVASVVGAVSMVSACSNEAAKRKEAETNGCQVRAVAAVWLNSDGACPTAGKLVRENRLKPEGANDPWGREWVIECPEEGEEDVVIRSKGADGVAGNSDDVRIRPEMCRPL